MIACSGLVSAAELRLSMGEIRRGVVGLIALPLAMLLAADVCLGCYCGCYTCIHIFFLCFVFLRKSAR